MPGRFAFLPFLRSTVSAEAALMDDTGRLGAGIQLEITGDGAAQGNRVSMPVTLRGPGDVSGIDPAQIARFEPAPGQRGFEPSYFPFVEFVDADFPWRFSLTTGTPRWVWPWLALIALRPDEFDLLDQGRALLPRLRVHSVADSLPDLSHAWAWAHVQVNLDDVATDDPVEALAADPANGFARLFCCRKLDERTRYHLFLVPTYAAGRLTGLGLASENPDSPDSLAWSGADSGALELPYYAQAEFITDASADLESLVRRLRAFRADEGDEPGAPTRASAADPGYYDGYTASGQDFQIASALNQAALKDAKNETDPKLAGKMSATLAEVIAGEGDDPDEDPLVAFPPYGFRFRQEKAPDPATAKKANGYWYDRLNLDLAMRHAAARGAAVVQENQEEFAQIAWTQYDAVMEANQRLRQLRLAEALASRLDRKHFRKLEPGVATVLSEPISPYVPMQSRKRDLTVTDAVRDTGAPTIFASRDLRRLSAKRPVTLKSGSGAVSVTLPTPAIKGAAMDPPNGRVKPPMEFVAGNRLTGAAAAHFSLMFGANFQTKTKRAPQVAHFVRPLDNTVIRDRVAATLVALPALKADFVVRGRTLEEEKQLDPIWRSPSIPEPLAPMLTRLNHDAILSGAGDLPDNTVSLFVENRAFIEAFMAGANHAMNDELRWREFPTDMRGTIFDRFWNRGLPLDDALSAQIGPIHEWTRALGRNPDPANPDGNEALVVVIRGDIVRKLGDPIVVVNRGPGTDWKPGRGTDIEPVFFGKLGRETAYFGFDLDEREVLNNRDDYCLIIMEPMGRLRFGLDVANAQVRRDRQNPASISLPFPMKARSITRADMPVITSLKPAPGRNAVTGWDDLSWSNIRLAQADYVNFDRTVSVDVGDDLWGATRSSASLARALWQKPIAAVVPFTRILP